MGLDLGTISASVGLNTAPLAAGTVKAKAMFSGLDKSMSGGMKNGEKGLVGLGNKLKALAGFGGQATNSMGAFGGQLGALGAIGLAAGAVVGLGAAFYSCAKAAEEEQKINAQTNAVIASTGGVANVTAAHVNKLGDDLASVSGVSHDVIKAGENIMLTFRGVQNIGKDKIFDESIKSTLDMSVALKKDLSDSAIKVGKALQDPVKGLTALRRYGVMFTDQQVDMAKAMVKSGDMLGAQKMIIQELNTEFGGSARALGETLPGKIAILKDGFDRLKESIGAGLLPVIERAVGAMAKWDWSKIGTDISSAVSTAVNTIQSIWKVLDTLKIPAALTAFAHTLADLASAWNEAFGPSKVDGTFKQRTEYYAAGYATVSKAASAHLPTISNLNKKLLQDASNTLIGEVPAFKANATGLMNAVSATIKSTDLKGATREKIASIAQQIAASTNLPVANVKALMDQLAGKISAADLRTPTGQTMKQITDGIAKTTGLGVAEIGTLLNVIKGRISAESLAGASQEMVNTMAKGISDATGYDEESLRRLLTILSQTAGSASLYEQGSLLGQSLVNGLAGPLAAACASATSAIGKIKAIFGQPIPGPTVGAVQTGNAISSASSAIDRIKAIFGQSIPGPVVGPTRTDNPGIRTWATNAQAGGHVAGEVLKGMESTFAGSQVNPILGGASGGSAMSDLAAATALVNASFGNFIGAMTAEPLNEVNDAIMRLTANNTASLGDWWKLRGAYDAATKSLLSYESQIKTAEAAVTSLEGKIEKANAARERPSLVMDKESTELQLAIMKAEDAHNYALVNKLNIQKDLLDRKKEELDLTTSIADKTKELKDTSAFAGKTTAQIDAMIATWSAALLKKTSQVAALKVTYDKVQTSVDKFKKIIDDLSAYFTSKSPAPTGYAGGTPYVPRTGMALVHQGEQIIPANLNPLVLGRGEATLITVPLYLDGKLVAKSVSRYQGGQANSRAMSGGRY